MCIVMELPGNVFVRGEGSLATNLPRACALRDRHFTVLAAFLDFFLILRNKCDSVYHLVSRLL